MIKKRSKTPDSNPTVRIPLMIAWAALALVYFLTAKLGLLLSIADGNITPVWPPTGISLAVLLLLGFRLWPGVWLGAFLATWSTGAPLLSAAGVAVGNTLEVLAGAWLALRFTRLRQLSWRVRDILGFVTLAALLSTTISATLGVSSLALGGVVAAPALAHAWWTWWIGDAVGALALAPLLLLWTLKPRPQFRSGWRLECALLLAAVLLVGQVVFGAWLFAIGRHYPLGFLFLPLLFWTAFRFGMHGAVTFNALLATISILGTVYGYGPFVQDSVNESLLLLQGFVGLMSVTALILAAVVSERSLAEQTLRESEERFRQLAENINEVFWIHSLDQKQLIYISPAYETVTGYSRERLYKNPGNWLAAVHPEDRQKVQQAFESMFSTHAFDQEYRVLRRDGAIRWIHDRGFPIHDANGRIYRMAGLAADLTERKQMEEQRQRHLADLAHLDRLSLAGEMASTLAHELNQPFTVIVTYGQVCQQMLRNDNRYPKEFAEAVDEMVAQGKRGGEIIRHLRRLVGKTEFRKQSIDINALIREAVQLAEIEIRSQNAKLEMALAEELPLVAADPVQIEQVVLNLIRNSMETMEQTQDRRALSIRTSLNSQAGEVEIVVADSGPGMSTEQIDRLFQPFFTTKPKGMGLGLPICRSIVEAHGGRLWVAPERNRGTAFHFTLPSINTQGPR